MSGKPEKPESPTAKVLQKARSFKHDLKSRIKRTPSASRADKEASPARKNRHHGNRKRVGRTGSFNEACKIDNEGKSVTDAERLDQDGIKVFSAIKYLRDVVNKGVAEQLSGATNIVLESVSELHQSISKYFLNQESTLLTSTYSQVYEMLANLILWADTTILDHPQTLDRGRVHDLIDPLENGVKDLIKLSKEKLMAGDTSSAAVMSKTLQRPPTHRKKTTSETRSPSVPESTPLTPHELKILDEGSALQKKSSLSATGHEHDVVEGKPPPKPPLPSNFSLKMSGKPTNADDDDVFTASTTTSKNEVPPPLPQKHKSRTRSSYDNTMFDLQAYDGAHDQEKQQSCNDNVDATVGSRSPTSSISSAASVASEELLLEECRPCGPRGNVVSAHRPDQGSGVHAPVIGKLGQRLSHYDNHCQWGAPTKDLSDTSSSTCDTSSTRSVTSTPSLTPTPSETPTPTPMPTKMFFDSSNIHRAQEQITQVTKQISHFVQHSGGYQDDSGIYDNKSFVSKGFYDNKQSLSMSVTTSDGAPPPLPEKTNRKPSCENVIMRNRVPSVYDNMSATESQSLENPRMAVESANAFAITAAKTEDITETTDQGRRFVQNTSKAALMAKSHNVRKVVTGGRQYTTESSMVSSGIQMRYMKETFGPGEGEDSQDDALRDWDPADGDPPPLPPKKRHVEEYMQMFGQSARPSAQELSRRSVRSMHFYQEQWQQHQMEVFMPMYPRSNTFSVHSARENASRDNSRVSDLLSVISGSSIDTHRSSDVMSIVSGSSSEDNQSVLGSAAVQLTPSMPEFPRDLELIQAGFSGLPDLPAKQRTSNTSSSSGVSSRQSDPAMTSSTQSEATEEEEKSPRKEVEVKKYTDSEKRSSAPTPSVPAKSVPAVTTVTPPPSKDGNKDTDSAFSEGEWGVLDEIDVSQYLVRKKADEDGPDLRGGSIDALIVHATTTGKRDFMYQEAFLTTYRSMMTSHDLVEKLIYRYNRFSRINDINKKKLSRNAFSLLTRVVNELCTEVDEKLIQMLMNLVFQMLCDGDLTLAKVLRSKVLEKCTYLQKLRESNQKDLWPHHKLSTRQYNLFNFKSQDIAEQLTLMDAELFQKIEIPEVLLWAKEQNEEHSPNLTMFTEHFNKMSYWCRTRILEQEDPRDREHCLVKFIKIMRYLEKFNNFNSYLAILSALSSSPLARLDWQKQHSEMLSQYFQLIDNTHGFRTYRLRLADTEPPCIPYIGLVLQDLTFVHVGNKDWLADGSVNFVKRWQQFNILDNMRRFRKCDYEFTRKEKIMQFFGSFDNYLPEETLWQISESIKPPKRTLYK